MVSLDMDEDEHTKEVYAQFGLAMYCAQAVESAIAVTLLHLDLIPKRASSKARTMAEWESEIDSFTRKQFEETLGGLIKRLRSVAPVPDASAGALRDALAKRNWLAHGYFWSRSEQFLSMSGRESMLKEIIAARGVFDRAESMLLEVVADAGKTYGITQAMVDMVFAEQIAKLSDPPCENDSK